MALSEDTKKIIEWAYNTGYITAIKTLRALVEDSIHSNPGQMLVSKLEVVDLNYEMLISIIDKSLEVNKNPGDN